MRQSGLVRKQRLILVETVLFKGIRLEGSQYPETARRNQAKVSYQKYLQTKEKYVPLKRSLIKIGEVQKAKREGSCIQENTFPYTLRLKVLGGGGQEHK